MKKTVPKKADIILFIAVILTAAVFFLLSLLADGGVYAVVYVDGEEIGRYALDADATFTVPSEDGGCNTVTVKDGEVFVSDADCPDRTCVHSKPVSRTGERVICLPHRMMIVIEGGDENEVDLELY